MNKTKTYIDKQWVQELLLLAWKWNSDEGLKRKGIKS